MVYEMFDIHSHIVPGVDDGSINIDMSIEMLRKAYNQGVRGIVCTSHDSCNTKDYFKNFKKLKQRVAKENISIDLYCGCEIYCDDYIIGDIIEELNNGNLLTINNTKYVLVEFNPYESSDVILKCIKKIVSSGYYPILAHTERCFDLSMNPQYVALLQECGCLFQVNAYSIVNEANKIIKDFAIKLLNEHIVSFIGSDAHRTTHRNYRIGDGVKYIYQNYNLEYAKDICYRNARQVLALN